ncbi:MAG: flagellar filament capping protein FliD [Clostridium chrysemydis]|uniref:flagellar filament capping protein FliD n=1 Tax=Clostridium chrysemydis TaxID=2665504 RepID=UPI003F3E52B3
MRIPGLATGMDTDSMVKEMMKPYQMKVDRVKQDNLRIKYQQDLYRDVLKQSQDFYNKYFSISSKDSLMSSSNWQTVGFTSGNESVVTAKGSAGSNVSNYSVEVEQIAKEAAVTLKDGSSKGDSILGKKLTIDISKDGGGTTEAIEVDLTGVTDCKEGIDKINEQLKGKGFKAEYSDFSKGIVLKSEATGANQTIKVSDTTASTPGTVIGQGTGQDIKAKITNSRGEVYPVTGASNSLTLDGITFDFHGVSQKDSSGKFISTNLAGKNDVTKTKDLIVNFVNDYNKLIENMNKQLLTKHDKSYTPLTDEQRKDMSEDQQKLWDKKAKEGLLKGDMNLDRINDKLKGIMRTNFGGMNLEKIGIIPVNNYGEQNGMFTIDEFKLEEALEKNPGEVKDLFLRQPVDDKDPSTGGILSKMKDTLYNETVSVSSPLMKKAGMEGSVTAFNNELTTTMEKKQKIIAEMERDLATRENNYYLQFSRLETQMNKLNSQNAYLMAQLGGGK